MGQLVSIEKIFPFTEEEINQIKNAGETPIENIWFPYSEIVPSDLDDFYVKDNPADNKLVFSRQESWSGLPCFKISAIFLLLCLSPFPPPPHTSFPLSYHPWELPPLPSFNIPLSLQSLAHSVLSARWQCPHLRLPLQPCFHIYDIRSKPPSFLHIKDPQIIGSYF